MPGVLAKIRALSNSFTAAQSQLAATIVGDSDSVPFLSVHELAERAGVSVASVSRFVRVVGYESYKAFKTQLGVESVSSFEGMYEAIRPRDSDEEIVDKVFGGNIRSLEQTCRNFDRDDLLNAAAVVSRAQRIVFFGIGSSGNIAQDSALRFSQLDLQAEAYTDSYQMTIQALRQTRGGVAVGISHSGRSTVTVKALEVAAHRGAFTIGISNYLESPLHRASACFLLTSFEESRVRVAALSSRIAQMCLLDALYLLVARYRKTRRAMVELLNTNVEELLRLPAK